MSEKELLNGIAKELMGTTYEELLESDPEEADMIYCESQENAEEWERILSEK